MSAQKLHRFSHRFSITQQYGPVGWVVLAAIVAVGSALIAVAPSSANIASASVHRAAATRSENVACNALGHASGAMDHVAVFDVAQRQMSLCR